MEEVLSKHRARNSITENGERLEETDEDKMKHQLLLDVTALKSHISNMGLEVPASYNDVFTLVSNAYYTKYSCLLHYFIYCCPFQAAFAYFICLVMDMQGTEVKSSFDPTVLDLTFVAYM